MLCKLVKKLTHIPVQTVNVKMCIKGALIYRFFLPGLAMWLLGSCIEKFEPETDDFESALVVEGFISDGLTVNTVKLSRSMPLGLPEHQPELAATVYITTHEGLAFAFNEMAPGIYQSDPQLFEGAPSEEYTLHIITADGAHYQSDPVLLKRTPPIDSIYFERAIRLTEIAGETLHGIAILLDTHNDTNGTRFYRWEWEEAWEIKVPYPNTYDWVLHGGELTPTAERPGYAVLHDRNVHICYNNNASKEILVSNSLALKEDRISAYELTYVSTEGYKLNSLYSILVRQFAIDEREYTYWSELERVSETLGTLFDPQPYELRGNIRNINNQEELVLGFFSASTVSEARIFIDRRQLEGVVYPISSCIEEKVEVENKWVQSYIDQGYQIVGMVGYGSPFYYLAPGPCCDCTYHGTLEKPDFWPE